MKMTPALLREIRERNLAGENDAVIARATGLRANLVYTYRRRMGLPARRPALIHENTYVVWDAETDELLACGDSASCAHVLGFKNRDTFHQMVSRVKHGKMHKYHVEVISWRDEKEEQQDAAN